MSPALPIYIDEYSNPYVDPGVEIVSTSLTSQAVSSYKKDRTETMNKPRAKHITNNHSRSKVHNHEDSWPRLSNETIAIENTSYRVSKQRNSLTWLPWKLHRASRRPGKPSEANEKRIGFSKSFKSPMHGREQTTCPPNIFNHARVMSIVNMHFQLSNYCNDQETNYVIDYGMDIWIFTNENIKLYIVINSIKVYDNFYQWFYVVDHIVRS